MKRYRPPHSNMSTTPEDVHYRYSVDTKNISEDDNMPLPATSRRRSLIIYAVSMISGVLFGISIEKGRVFEPQMIRGQMLFEKFTMLKMFLSAVAMGTLGFSILNMIPATVKLMQKAEEEYFGVLVSKTVGSAAVGGALLGCGMTLSGACPGMVLAQVGAAVPYSVLTMLGGIGGALLFALAEPSLSKMFKPARPPRTLTLDDYMDTPYFILALPFAAMLGLVVVAVELFVPWTSEVELSGSGIMGSRAWPPFFAGMLIGSLQIPTVLVMQDTLGSSTSYMTAAAQLLRVPPLRSLFPHLRKFKTGVMNWWQVFYVSGAIFGAHISARSSDTLGTVSGVGPWHSLMGGTLMIFGSRLAGGCTSGHGLSGMGMLLLLSFVAVPSMFAGGISTAVFMKYGLGVDM